MDQTEKLDQTENWTKLDKWKYGKKMNVGQNWTKIENSTKLKNWIIENSSNGKTEKNECWIKLKIKVLTKSKIEESKKFLYVFKTHILSHCALWHHLAKGLV